MKRSRNVIAPSILKAAVLIVCAILALAALASCGSEKTSSGYSVETRGGKLFITSFDNGSSDVKDYTVPSKINGNSVYGIASGAYKNCEFASLVIPEGIEVIESGAFSGCSELVSVTVPSTVTELEGAFRMCGALKEMNIKSAGYEVKDGFVFSKDGKTLVFTLSGAIPANGDYTVPDTVEKIAAFAMNRSDMSSVTLPAGLLEIGEQAFYSCKSLKKLVINCPDLKIGTFAFGYCSALTDLEIKDVYSIGEDAFRRCGNLKTVQAENVDYIGTGSFRMCPELSSVYIAGSYNYIPADLFSGCTKLDDCMLDGDFSSDRINMFDGNEIHAVNNSAFSGCSSLPAPIIPDGITKIGPYAFNQCSFSVAYIPDGIKSIAEMAFYECDSLKYVRLPSTLETVGFQAFAYCESLPSVTIPESVRVLGIMSFYSCYQLSDVTLEEGGCGTLGVLCFGNCTSLTRLKLPMSFTGIMTTDGNFFTSDIKETLGYDFTIRSDGSKSVVYEVYKYSYGYEFVNENGIQFETADNSYDIFTVTDTDGGVEITGVKDEYKQYIHGHETLTVPETIGGKPVVAIASGALSVFTGESKLILPATLVSFADGALNGMNALRTVVLTGTEPERIAITPAVSGNIRLITFCVPATAFARYSEAFGKIFGDGAKVENDPDSLFDFAEYSGGYRVVSIIKGVDVSSMTSISIPEKYNGKPVLALSANALSEAVSAVDIYIPASVVRIFDGAFSGCRALRFLHLMNDADATVVGSGLLSGTEDVKICVPEQFAPNYLASYEWQGYTIKSE